MALSLPLVASVLVGLVAAQTPVGSGDNHPKLTTWKCTQSGGCVSQNTALVLDSGTHWIHQKSDSSKSCTSSSSANGLDPSVCPDAATCAQNCVIEGITDYSSHGVTTSGGSLHLEQIASDGSTLSPRLYLLAEDQTEYEMLHLTGGELAYDVDVSKLPCGMNGALYLSEMNAKGGASSLNKAGAAYGTGYCDAQCFTSPFVDGVANIDNKGACCNEMDIWEANAEATQMAPHTCSKNGPYGCTGDECGASGVCDKNGCGQNPYGIGNKQYYGDGMTVDTSRPFTVVTQFVAGNSTTNSTQTLSQIKRLYVQDGKVIQNAAVNVTGQASVNYVDDTYCKANGASMFESLGGVQGMGGALSRGMVLIFSIWWDTSGYMTWLDSGNAGPCNATEGNPTVIQKVQPHPAVTFSNIKWGEIGSTYGRVKRNW